MATAPAAGTRLTARQIAKYAYDAGFRGEALRTAVAIAMAESGGFTGAHNPNGEDSRGLWQINVAPNVRPNKWGDLSDPVVNARAAFEVSGGGKNFTPWTTYTGATAAGRHSSFREHYDEAMIAAQSVEVNPGDVILPAEEIGAAGVSGASATVDELPPDATPEQITRYIEINYPQAAPFLANDEIRSLLVRPDIDDMDVIEIEALLRKTNYWQTHGPESRAFDALIGTDGAAAGALVDTAKNTLGDFLSRSGVPYTDEQLGEAAKKAIRAGWINLAGQVANPNALNDFAVFALGTSRNLDGSLPAGTARGTAEELGVIANQFFVPMTRQDLERWALDIQAGKATDEMFKQEMAWHAKSLFQNAPDAIRAIESGRTPTEYFAPIRNIIAQTLELAPDQVDLMSPRYREVLQMHDPKAGTSRPMTLAEATRFARNQDEFRDTREYQTTEAELEVQLARSMGVLA